ncbi:carboxylic acid reductase [Nocardia yamanashiensis]|uniref:carboxylic acid reductase n=1 Tax=Nocardia yamanashiensis TaxID=209247 RepID=UPI00082C5E20|nr:carboxylic acid reductase [Nocardia yamanashiensis]
MTEATREEARAARFSELLTELLADEQLRAAQPKPEVAAAVRAPGLSLAGTIAVIMEHYADRPAIGWRTATVVTDASGRRARRLLPGFETISYRELWRHAGELAAAWRDDAETPVRVGDFVAVLGFAGLDTTILDLGCVRAGAVIVPLQASAAAAQWHSILAETGARVLAVSLELLDAVVDGVRDGSPIETIVVFDYERDDDQQAQLFEQARQRLSASGAVRLEGLDDVLARGRTLPPIAAPATGGEEALALLVYTSGSTGTPKGAMYTERLVTHMWAGPTEIPVPVVNVGYMPMSHVAGRLVLAGALARGGTTYFTAESDLSTLFEDIALVRPTELFFVPRVCDLVFQQYQRELRRLIEQGVDPDAADETVKTELRQRFLGGRLARAMVGSAPVSAEMKAFIESVLQQVLHDGYGSTEAGGGLILDGEVRRPPVLDYRLADVPELGYFTTDKPYPRGEFLVKTTQMIPGYFKRPDVTAEIFDADGFYRTGDIVAELEPDRLVYLDRRNNVLKLSQGEFVAVAKLEALYATSPLIRQIFVYGASERAFLLAVIVPTPQALELDPAELPGALARSLQGIAKDNQLESFELPRGLLLETEPFTVENGLLSGIGKLLRPKLKERFSDRLHALYDDLEKQQVGEMDELRNGAATRPVGETVVRAAKAVLGAVTEPPLDARFIDLGGDSLSALTFSTLLRDCFEVEVPVGLIVGPATELRRLAEYIETERHGTRPTAASVHAQPGEIRASELTLDKFIDAETLYAATSLPSAPAEPVTVLLTGANGYLGRFLLLEWLERMDHDAGRVICVVRGSDAESARARLDTVFDSGDPELLAHYRDLAARRLEVLAGDIGEPNLGLTEPDWQRLAATVDLIVHPAALVNHVLPYDQLFGPNVVGTAEIIRLALTTQRKPVTYLSTVAVAAQVAPDAFEENGDVREFSAVRSVDDGYANGYGNSKWAGEVLLRDAHDRFGLPVAVFRSDMILAHSRFRGQFNLPDMFTRLMLSLLATGIAPKSFYATNSHGNRRAAHYDGLPADFTAAAITVLGAANVSGFATYDVINPHRDGISLDTFVDWLIEAGQPIERIDDYAEWFARFETALRALPERRRRDSVLPLLHAYRRPAPPLPGAALPAEHFQAAVRTARIGPTGTIPHLSRELIGKYVADLRLLDLL